MKKTVLLLFAFMATITAFGQNLAQEQPSIASSGDATFGNDGNEGTRWESTSTDPQTWQVDLGEGGATFNTISIRWEGAYGKTFTIEVGDDLGTDGYLTGGEEVVNVSGQVLSGVFPYVQNFQFSNKNARYVKFNGIERGTSYGYSFWELGVYNLTTDLLVNSIEISTDKTQTTVGSTVNFSAICKDQLGGVLNAEGLTWTSSNSSVGTVENGVFTALLSGETTITASKDGVVSNSITINVTAGEKIDLFTNWDTRIYTIGETDRNSIVGAFDDNDGSLWQMWKAETGADEASRTYECGFVADLGALYDVTSLSIHFEGACSEDFSIYFAGADGVFGTATYNGGAAGINNHTETFSGETVSNARYVKFLSRKASTQWTVKIYDFTVNGVKKSDIEDTEIPTIVSATVGDVADESVTLNIIGDDNSSKFLTYEISFNGTTTNYALDTNVTGQAASVVVSGLNGATNYEFSIVGIDGKQNRSAATTVSATTTGETFILTAAPVPTHAAEDVISIYSNRYDAATSFYWGGWGQSTVVAEETVDGNTMYKLTKFNYLGFDGFNPQLDLSEMDYIHIDILPLQAMKFGITPIMTGGKTENSQSVETLNVKEWNSIDIPMTQFGFDFSYKAFQLKIDQGNGSDEVYIDNIYFWKESSAEPTEISLETSATEVQVGKTVQLTVKDQNNNAVAASKVTFASEDPTVATVDEAGVVTGIEKGSTIITATLVSDNTVTATVNITVTAAPEGGQVLTADGHSITLFPYHYNGTANYELIITSEETMKGLGGSFWHINGNEPADIRTNMTISDDGKTITITATSNKDPQLYTPLYVLMPGEVNFGQPTLNWIEKGGSTAEITAITVEAAAAEVQAGKTVQLTVKDQDNNVVAASQVTFVSSDDAIATVDENGVVTGVAEGEVTITAMLKDNTAISNTVSINVTAAASDALVAGEADANGLVKLTGTWDAVEFAAIDAVKQANSYDLTEVAHEGTIDVKGKTANPYCIFVTPVAGTVNRNEAVATDGGYNGYAMFFQEGVNAEAPFDINTAIAPISVGNPFFQRLFDRAGYFVTMTVPFDYAQIPEASNGTKFYELKASTNGETVTLNFTEVSSIVANKPYLVYSGTGGITIPDPGTVTIDWNAQTETADGASFVANYKALQPLASENVYVVPAGITEEAKVSFMKSANATIRPFRAYLTLSSATKINITFGDEEATAIRGISDDVLNALFDVYSIDGKKVKSAGQKMFGLPAGLYIINGKKVVMK